MFGVTADDANRKGDHILAMADRHLYGVDHVLTFHSDHKLPTVLWGWIGGVLSAEEIASLAARCARLPLAGQFPAPSGQMSPVPLPLF